MDNKDLVSHINEEFALEFPEKISLEDLQAQLSVHINHLIEKNFDRLISLLYRIDVSETKLKSLLLDHPANNAGDIIASLIIERQLQKIKTRQEFKNNSPFDEEEKW